MKAILVVDDDQTVQVAIESVMACLFPQIKVWQAANGREGITIAQSEQPEIILLDGNMPVLNGYETAKILKEHPSTNHINLVGISGSDIHDPTTFGLRQLCDTWLPKPFAPDDLALLLSRYQVISDYELSQFLQV